MPDPLLALTDIARSFDVSPPWLDRVLERKPRALLKAAKAMKHGMKYERGEGENWRGVPAEIHLDHALRHIALWKQGHRSEDHVGHIGNRMLMWGELTEGGADGE